jgi:hypothetical protein
LMLLPCRFTFKEIEYRLASWFEELLFQLGASGGCIWIFLATSFLGYSLSPVCLQAGIHSY